MNIKISKLFVFITIIILVIIVSSLFYIKEIRKNAIEIKEYGYLGTFGKNATKKFKDSLSFISQVPF